MAKKRNLLFNIYYGIDNGQIYLITGEIDDLIYFVKFYATIKEISVIDYVVNFTDIYTYNKDSFIEKRYMESSKIFNIKTLNDLLKINNNKYDVNYLRVCYLSAYNVSTVLSILHNSICKDVSDMIEGFYYVPSKLTGVHLITSRGSRYHYNISELISLY